MEIKFKHYRNPDEDFDTVSNLGGVTITFRQLDADSYQLGIAVCSGKDNFCYATGRSISTDRMLKNPLVVSKEEMEDLLSQHDVFDLFFLSDAIDKVDDHFKTRTALAFC